MDMSYARCAIKQELCKLHIAVNNSVEMTVAKTSKYLVCVRFNKHWVEWSSLTLIVDDVSDSFFELSFVSNVSFVRFDH